MRMSRRFAMLGLAATGIAAGQAGLAAAATRAGTAFGTIVRLTISAQSQSAAEACCDAGFAAIRMVERSFSLFDPQSELRRLNASAVLRSPSPMMLDVMSQAKTLWQITDGAFDPTVQKLWEAWNRDSSKAPGEVSALRNDIGFQHIEVSPTEISLPNRNATLTFNGIAQGYACDCVARAIVPMGAAHAVLDTGEVAVLGEAAPEHFAIMHPRKPGEFLRTINLSKGFVATSGDYASSFTPDFAHHHIFDPATAASPRELAAATVVAESGAMADGLATAFMVMGLEKSARFIARYNGVSAMLIKKDMSVHGLGKVALSGA